MNNHLFFRLKSESHESKFNISQAKKKILLLLLLLICLKQMENSIAKFKNKI